VTGGQIHWGILRERDHIPCSTTRRRSDGVEIRLQQTDKIVEQNLGSDPDKYHRDHDHWTTYILTTKIETL
jgi:hypothetical protein